MREFKSGTLKSGGSGKKVTNPKQAIAIALSEANAMNQGGMMQNPVMQRPMFQNPMQRESMGIMAGVAPIRGYAEGGEAEDSLGDELFRLLVVDVNDPVDVAISSAAAGMAVTGIGGPAAALAKLAGTGRKLFRGADAAAKAAAKAEEKVKKMEQAGLFRKAASKAGEKVGRFAAEKEVMSIGSDAIDQITPPIRMTMAEGGIASLPVVYAANGGLMALLQKFGPSILKRIKKKDKQKEDKPKKESKKKEDEEQPEEEVIIEGGGSRVPGLDYVKENPIKSFLTALGLGSTASIVGPPLLSSDDEDPSLPPSPPPPGPPPSVQSLPAGGGVMQLDASGNPQGLVPGVGVNPGGDDTDDAVTDDDVTKTGGVRDFLTNTISKLQDPRLQYQLAKAAQPSEGFTPRNFFSDVTLAGQEYDDMKAKRDYLEAQTRSEQKTDLEKLTDFYMTTLDTEGLTSDQTSEIRRQFAISLFKDQQRAGEMETLVEILSLIANSDQAVEIFKKFEGGESSFDKAMADALVAIQRAKGP